MFIIWFRYVIDFESLLIGFDAVVEEFRFLE